MVSGQVLGTLVSINVVTYTSQCRGISVHISYKAGSDVIYQARKMWEIALLSLFIHTHHKTPTVLPDRLLNSGQELCIMCPRNLSTKGESLWMKSAKYRHTKEIWSAEIFFSIQNCPLVCFLRSIIKLRKIKTRSEGNKIPLRLLPRFLRKRNFRPKA